VLSHQLLMREGVRRIEVMMPLVKDLKDDEIDAWRSTSLGSPPQPAMSRSIPPSSNVAANWPLDCAVARAISPPWPDKSRCRDWPSSASTT
jgi:hypothetical protein